VALALGTCRLLSAGAYASGGAAGDALHTVTGVKSAAWEEPEALAEQLASNPSVQKHLFRAPITKAHLVASLVRSLQELRGSTAAPTSPVDIQVVAGPASASGHPTIALHIA
jgi:hypothetical protein